MKNQCEPEREGRDMTIKELAIQAKGNLELTNKLVDKLRYTYRFNYQDVVCFLANHWQVSPAEIDDILLDGGE